MVDPKKPECVRSEYDKMSGAYGKRYEINPLNGVKTALIDLVIETGARRVLEIGCGTGHWLKALASDVERIMGLDPSIGMLHKALDSPGPIELVCGSAEQLPFLENSFDLIFVVNAIHHFADKKEFIHQASLLLRPGGTLATIGVDVESAVGHWVVYDYFPGAIEFDRSRFPGWELVQAWMTESGLAACDPRVVEHIDSEKRGSEILEDHFIQRHGTSQFMGLTEDQYQTGIDRLRAAISDAEARGEEAVFQAHLQFKMVVGFLRK